MQLSQLERRFTLKDMAMKMKAVSYRIESF